MPQGKCLTKERKKIAIDKLKRIEGRIKGLVKMLEDDRYCIDVMMQISSTHEALRVVGKGVIQNYLEICATEGINSKDTEKQQEIYGELMDVIYKYVK
jgi:DNA-binding FrmR family transcriptional regulator